MTIKLKTLFQNRLFLCIVMLLIGGSVSVYAVTYFPSSQTTYDNSNSGLKSTDVQGAIDELYTACSTPTVLPTLGESILNNTDIVTTGNGLYADEYEDGKYFYKGENPNNYITFNNEIAGWRIISINSDGTVKIIRNTSIGNQNWGGSSNDWANSSSLNTYLNKTYYNNLNSTAKNQIVSKNFSIGAVTNNETNLTNTISGENSKKWNGKIALATASEYIRSNSNKSGCGTMDQVWRLSSCGNTTWMNNGNYWWILTAYSETTHTVFYVYPGGYFGYGDASNSFGIRPVTTLSSKARITGGIGTKSDPYQISL